MLGSYCNLHCIITKARVTHSEETNRCVFLYYISSIVLKMKAFVIQGLHLLVLLSTAACSICSYSSSLCAFVLSFKGMTLES